MRAYARSARAGVSAQRARRWTRAPITEREHVRDFVTGEVARRRRRACAYHDVTRRATGVLIAVDAR